VSKHRRPDIGTLNGNYFTTIDAIVKVAERHGRYCAVTPLGECQWSKANIDKTDCWVGSS
jgi:hypothetical protein